MIPGCDFELHTHNSCANLSDLIINKNDHRSGGAVKEGCPYIFIKHIIKL